jgi:hypothetical protein
MAMCIVFVQLAENRRNKGFKWPHAFQAAWELSCLQGLRVSSPKSHCRLDSFQLRDVLYQQSVVRRTSAPAVGSTSTVPGDPIPVLSLITW